MEYPELSVLPCASNTGAAAQFQRRDIRTLPTTRGGTPPRAGAGRSSPPAKHLAIGPLKRPHLRKPSYITTVCTPKPAKPEPNRLKYTQETRGAGGEVEAAADGALPRAPRRGALLL